MRAWPVGLAELLEGVLGHFRLQKVEVGVCRQGALEVLAGSLGVPERSMNQPGMEEEPGVLRAELQRLRHGGQRGPGPAGLEERPGQHVVGVDVAPDIKLSFDQFQGLPGLEVVIGVEECQFAVVHRLVDRVQVVERKNCITLSARRYDAARRAPAGQMILPTALDMGGGADPHGARWPSP
jgi:hypothetical protein